MENVPKEVRDLLSEAKAIATNIGELLDKLEGLYSDFRKYQSEIETDILQFPRFRFPRGVISKSDKFKYNFLNKRSNLASNIAYTLMTIDVYEWLITRSDIGLAAKSILIKQVLVMIGAAIEAMLTYTVKRLCGVKSAIGVRAACSVLVYKNIISEDEKKKIIKLWEKRNSIHISDKEKEHNKYTEKDYKEARAVLDMLIERLEEAKKKKLI